MARALPEHRPEDSCLEGAQPLDGAVETILLKQNLPRVADNLIECYDASFVKVWPFTIVIAAGVLPLKG